MRARERELRGRLYAATLDLLRERGFEGLSLRDVVRRAGSRMPAVLTRYEDTGDLATSALADAWSADRPGWTDDLRSDLTAELQHLHLRLVRPDGTSMVAALLDGGDDRRRLLRDRLLKPLREALVERLDRAVADGRLPATADTEALGGALVGAFGARYFAEARMASDWAERAVAQFWTLTEVA